MNRFFVYAREESFPLLALGTISLGILLLLQTTDVVPWNLWSDIWRFWPLILIAAGINILYGRMPLLAGGLIVAALVVGVILAALTGSFSNKSASLGIGAAGSVHELLGETQSADVKIDFASGDLRLGSLPEGSKNLVEAEFQGREAEVLVSRSHGSAELDISTSDFSYELIRNNIGAMWDVSLSSSPGMSIDVDAGASEMTLDLRQLNVDKLSIDAGAADLEVTMPADAGEVRADIDVGAADILVIIPEGVGAMIDVSTAVGSLSVDQVRFPRQGNIYVSPNFSSLANRIHLNIDSGASDIKVR